MLCQLSYWGLYQTTRVNRRVSARSARLVGSPDSWPTPTPCLLAALLHQVRNLGCLHVENRCALACVIELDADRRPVPIGDRVTANVTDQNCLLHLTTASLVFPLRRGIRYQLSQ